MVHLKTSDTFGIIIYPQMSNNKPIVNRAYGHKHSTNHSKKFRKSKNLLLSYYKHERIKMQTISRYVKPRLKAASINTKILTAHLIRHASSTGKSIKRLSLNDIVKKGRWKSWSLFRQFSDIPVINNM